MPDIPLQGAWQVTSDHSHHAQPSPPGWLAGGLEQVRKKGWQQETRALPILDGRSIPCLASPSRVPGRLPLATRTMYSFPPQVS